MLTEVLRTFMYAVLYLRIGSIVAVGHQLGVLHTELLCHRHELFHRHNGFAVSVKQVGIAAREVLRQGAYHHVCGGLQPAHVKQIVYICHHKVSCERTNLNVCRAVVGYMTVEVVQLAVAYYGRRTERLAQHQSVERLAAAQSHIGLTVRKGV